MPRKTIAQLEAEVADLEATHKLFKENVVKVARDYADTHGWCEVVEQALVAAELVEPTVYTVTVTYEVTGNLSDDVLNYPSSYIDTLNEDEVIFEDYDANDVERVSIKVEAN